MKQIRKIHTHISLLLILTISFTVIGCARQQAKPNKEVAQVVVTAISKTQDVPVYISTFGNIYAPYSVNIRPQVTGKLLKAHVPQGAFVEEGQLLFTIDPAPYKAALDKAIATKLKDQASVQLAQITIDRNKELVAKDYVARLTFEQYEANLANLEAVVLGDQADIETAEINLKYCYLHSPITGRMGQYQVDPGNIVSLTDTTPITSVRQIDPIDVYFALPQVDYQRVKEAQVKNKLITELELPGGIATKQDKIIGDVYFIDNMIDLSSGTILIKASISNENKKLWPGDFVHVNLLLDTVKDATVVPFDAIQIGQKGEFVFVVKPDMTIEVRQVTLGEHYGDQIVISDGIKPGEKVVTDGQINLRAGTKVVEKKAGETPAVDQPAGKP